MVVETVAQGDLVTIAMALYADGLSIRAVASKLNVGRERIYELLKEQNVVRSRADGIRRSKNTDVIMTDELRHLVDGLLLGDGHLTRGRLHGERGESALILRQTEAHLEWVEQVRAQLGRAEVSTTLKLTAAKNVTTSSNVLLRMKPIYTMRTRSLVSLSHERARWYTETRKRLPEDVSVEPRAVVTWFFGDGSNGTRQMKFCTQNFTTSEAAHLCSRLGSRYGWAPKMYLDRGLPVLVLTRSSDIVQLRDMLREHAPKCFERKWMTR